GALCALVARGSHVDGPARGEHRPLADALCDAGSVDRGAWRRVNLVLMLTFVAMATVLGLLMLRGVATSHGTGWALYRAFGVLGFVQALSRYLFERLDRGEAQLSRGAARQP